MASHCNYQRKHPYFTTILRALIIALAITASACSTTSKTPQLTDLKGVYSVEIDNPNLLAQHAPLLRVEQNEQDHNKIGTVIASKNDANKIKIDIDTSQATLYGEQISFQGEHGRYTNLIYRFHFSRVPFSLLPFSLTYGSNVGLFVIITLNEAEKPILVSAVHSCGCYLAFIPTDQLIDSAFPKNWPKEKQTVFGESLPSIIKLTDNKSRFIIDLRNSNHRVHNVSAINKKSLSGDSFVIPMRLSPIDSLRNLPLGDGTTTSMFTNKGARKGYVKGSNKPFEALLMSWWAFDPQIGVDKDYGDPEKTGTIFYTSLKPWHRKASNMWPFTGFLEFWGWSL
ncbi:MAG: hypothetical protein GXP21_00290 [Gammaproteobacteria bacterium]|nr:hypothetical protein [Gammaproteobacteria bacterium]